MFGNSCTALSTDAVFTKRCPSDLSWSSIAIPFLTHLYAKVAYFVFFYFILLFSFQMARNPQTPTRWWRTAVQRTRSSSRKNWRKGWRLWRPTTPLPPPHPSTSRPVSPPRVRPPNPPQKRKRSSRLLPFWRRARSRRRRWKPEGVFDYSQTIYTFTRRHTHAHHTQKHTHTQIHAYLHMCHLHIENVVNSLRLTSWYSPPTSYFLYLSHIHIYSYSNYFPSQRNVGILSWLHTTSTQIMQTNTPDDKHANSKQWCSKLTLTLHGSA